MTTSKELFLQSSRPMRDLSKSHQSLTDAESNMILSKSLTRDQATQLLGRKYKDQIIVGVTSSPGLSYVKGTYLTLASMGEPLEHIYVGPQE